MLGSPKSLTAIVHVRFQYEELEAELGGAELDMIGKILERASKLEPDMREIMLKFADFLQGQGVGQKEDGQDPS
jgi:hypothetical protein